MADRSKLLVLLLAGGLTARAIAETQLIRPAHVRPEDVEAVVTRLVPKAGVAAVPRQGAVVVSGDADVLAAVARVIRELDAPNRVVELEVGVTGSNESSERSAGLGASLKKARGREVPPVPSELRQTGGSSRSSSHQSIIAMPGSPVEVFIGETQLRDGGPTSPPIELQIGKKIRIESLRVVEDGKGAEMDVMVENTVPGAGPVVSSGTRVKTAVRLLVGQTQSVAVQDESGGGETGTGEVTGDDSGGQARRRRSRVSGSSSGTVTITLKNIR